MLRESLSPSALLWVSQGSSGMLLQMVSALWLMSPLTVNLCYTRKDVGQDELSAFLTYSLCASFNGSHPCPLGWGPFSTTTPSTRL